MDPRSYELIALESGAWAKGIRPDRVPPAQLPTECRRAEKLSIPANRKTMGRC
jgi:hypothetical protein